MENEKKEKLMKENEEHQKFLKERGFEPTPYEKKLKRMDKLTRFIA